jgi:hypothetical protein
MWGQLVRGLKHGMSDGISSFPLLSAAVIAGLFRPLRMETTPRSSLAPHLVRDGGGIGAATQKGAWRGWRGARAKVLLTAEEGEGIRSAKFLLTDCHTPLPPVRIGV